MNSNIQVNKAVKRNLSSLTYMIVSRLDGNENSKIYELESERDKLLLVIREIDLQQNKIITEALNKI